MPTDRSQMRQVLLLRVSGKFVAAQTNLKTRVKYRLKIGCWKLAFFVLTLCGIGKQPAHTTRLLGTSEEMQKKQPCLRSELVATCSSRLSYSFTSAGYLLASLLSAVPLPPSTFLSSSTDLSVCSPILSTTIAPQKPSSSYCSSLNN